MQLFCNKKVKFLFFLFLKILHATGGSVIGIGSESGIFNLSCAFINITNNLSQLNRGLSVINAGLDGRYLSAVVLSHLKDDFIPLRMTNLKVNDTKVSYEVNESAIVTMETVDSLKIFNDKVKLLNRYPKSLTFYVYCRQSTFAELSVLKDSKILNFQYFIVDEDELIRLLTFVWYTPEGCKAPQLIEVNRFEKKTKKWKHSNFTTKKLENFHGCQLVLCFQLQSPSAGFFRKNGSITYWGYNLDMMEELSINLNYTFVFNPFIKETRSYLIKDLKCDINVTMFQNNDNVTRSIFVT